MQFSFYPNTDVLAATQAFGIFGFVSLNLGCLLLVLTMFYDKCKGNSEATLASGISLIVSAVTWLIAVIIFGASLHNDYNNDLDFSFALAVCALVLALVAGILVLLNAKGGTSVGSK
ncbi:hypothetical protein Btru_004996 [Bulinus truncatus]|nr:hypothetical protein Btru_004996 [Bulinus truncatus]